METKCYRIVLQFIGLTFFFFFTLKTTDKDSTEDKQCIKKEEEDLCEPVHENAQWLLLSDPEFPEEEMPDMEAKQYQLPLSAADLASEESSPLILPAANTPGRKRRPPQESTGSKRLARPASQCTAISTALILKPSKRYFFDTEFS